MTQHFDQHHARFGLIIHNQNAQGLYAGQACRGSRALLRAQETGGKDKARTGIGFAFCPDMPAHQLDKTLGNHQPQACPSVFSRGGAIRLAKLLEQVFHLFRRHADTRIAYGKA